MEPSTIEAACPSVQSLLPHECRARILSALDLAVRYGGNDGAMHKDWVIDQMVRLLSGLDYDSVVTYAKAGEDGPDTYDWDVGIAP